jgi:hypothetical protein
VCAMRVSRAEMFGSKNKKENKILGGCASFSIYPFQETATHKNGYALWNSLVNTR